MATSQMLTVLRKLTNVKALRFSVHGTCPQAPPHAPVTGGGFFLGTGLHRAALGVRIENSNCVTLRMAYCRVPGDLLYRGTSLIRNCHPPRTTIGP